MTDPSRPAPGSWRARFSYALAAASTGAPIPPIAEFFDVDRDMLESRALAWGLPALAALSRDGLIEYLFDHPDPRTLAATGRRPGALALSVHAATKDRLAYLAAEAAAGAAPPIAPDVMTARRPAFAGAGAAGAVAQ